MKFLLAKKVNMTQVFNEDGTAYPVTVLDAGPVTVTQIKDAQRDGYKAVQLGFGEKKEKNLTQAIKGHLKALPEQARKSFAYLREYSLMEGDEAPALGDTIDASLFAEGEKVTISAVSKGKGFQGVVKRHGFKGGRRSHGQKHSEREAGSIGGGGRAGGRVVKGMRMAGRMGGDRVTVANLEVVRVIPESNQLLVRGAVPGRRGTLVEVRGK